MKALVLVLLGLFSAAVASAQVIVLDNFNAGTTSGSLLGSPNSWAGPGNVVQNATTLTVGNTALDNNGWGATFAPINASGMNFIWITAKLDGGNAAPSLTVEIFDSTLTSKVFSVSTFSFSTGGQTLVQIPISSWGAVNPTDITDWTIGGGTNGSATFRMTFDNLALSATSAIPEPSTYAALFGIFALGAAVVRRRIQARALCAVETRETNL